jgi:hypothetical protein
MAGNAAAEEDRRLQAVNAGARRGVTCVTVFGCAAPFRS